MGTTTSHHIPVSLSCVCSEQQQTCISSSGSCFWAISCIPPAPPTRLFSISWFFFTLLPAKMLLLLLLPLIVTASQGPLPPDFEEASWQKVGIKLILVISETFKLTHIFRLLTTILHLRPRHCWPLFLASQKGKRSLRIE